MYLANIHISIVHLKQYRFEFTYVAITFKGAYKITLLVTAGMLRFV